MEEEGVVLALLLEEEAKDLILDLAAVQNSPSGEFYWQVVVEVLVMVALKMVVVEPYLGVVAVGHPLKEEVVVDLLLGYEVVKKPHLDYF